MNIIEPDATIEKNNDGCQEKVAASSPLSRQYKIIVDILDEYSSICSEYIPGNFNMSKALSLKINEDIYREVEEITKKYHIPRNTYINQALSVYNKLNRRKILKKQLAFESGLVGNNSLEVLAEFDKFEDEIPE